jgi:hypothetical protein
MMPENKSTKSCNKKIVKNNHNVSNDTTKVSSDNITMKTTNTNTKDNCHHGTSD